MHWTSHNQPAHHHGMYHAAYHGGHGHHFCHSCCHPVTDCCCQVRECIKEPKELLVTPEVKRDVPDNTKYPIGNMNAIVTPLTLKSAESAPDPEDKPSDTTRTTSGTSKKASTTTATISKLVSSIRGLVEAQQNQMGFDSTFIGGGCCVHLSVEYAIQTALVGLRQAPVGDVLVAVTDADRTLLVWEKAIEQDAGYQIKEGIIKTNPGALLYVRVMNAMARVRWCEIFSG